MSTPWAWLQGHASLESRFAREVERRKGQVEEPMCTYRGVTYVCTQRCGHWGMLEG